MVNMGKGELCDVRLEAVADSGKVYSFWPDWAETGSYEVDFGPKQVTAVGALLLLLFIVGCVVGAPPYL